jgi:uncharacterized C2H2 Zn-finger protein
MFLGRLKAIKEEIVWLSIPGLTITKADASPAPKKLELDQLEDEDVESSKNSSNDDIDHNLDYVMNDDGRCVCKLCGEIVASRTHWYRHKYKVHNTSLFRCDKCEIFFKSKKGYEGHINNKHAAKLIGHDGKTKTRKEMEGLHKVELQESKLYIIDN